MQKKLNISFFKTLILTVVISCSAQFASAELLDTLALDSAKVYRSLESALKNPDKVYKLKLSKLKLKEFPMEILKFKNLNYLDLSKNKLKSIPDEIKELKFLQHLDVSNNKIEALTPAMCELVELKNLIISQNEMEGFPYEIGNLTKLVRLDAWSNNIYLFPEELSKMVKLEWMDLRVIQTNIDQQKRVKALLPNTRVEFSPACNCNF